MTDLGELLYLLYDAHSRVQTVHAHYRSWENELLSSRAFDRNFERDEGWEEYERGRPTRPRESRAELWLEWPERVRKDTRSTGDGEHNILVTKDGEPWQYFPKSGVNRRVGGKPRHVAGIDVFDPAFLLTDLRLTPLGRKAVAGRDAIAVRVEPRASLWDHGFTHLDLLEELTVDGERGTLLSGVWRLEGEEMRRFEFERISFDEPIDPAAFVPDVPAEPRSWGADFPKAKHVTVAEAAELASFSVWELPHLPEGWSSRAWYVPDHPERPETVGIEYVRRDATARLALEQQSASSSEQRTRIVRETVERNGRKIEVMGAYGGSNVEVELEGTHVRIDSQLPMDSLVDIAATLARVR
ncbi:MAG: hypothetical protein H0T97_00625 [Actinobacteria bacterium]|nr:hypothetical protein [Actinomycetota bacterium]